LIQTVGFTKTLTATATQNGEVVTPSLMWTSNQPTLCSVTTGGVIHCLALGNATIRCTMADNATVYDEITIYVSASLIDDYDVVISPESQIIYEGDTQAYTCTLTNNGVLTSATFTFVPSGVPAENYRLYSIDGNHFSVENIKKYLTSVLTITCVSGAQSKAFEIRLRGDF
jgi:uncharacterized protein YjdB